MRNKFIVFAAFTVGIVSVALKNGGGGNHTTSSGAPASSTGAIGETSCAKSGCHDDNSVNNSLSTTTFNFGSGEEAYIPGNTYPITVTIENSNIQRFGFEIVAIQDDDTMNAGSMSITDPTRTQIINNELEMQDREYVTYTFNGTDPFLPGKGQWSFEWIAPEEGKGSVTFYLATVAANNDGTDDGDYVYTNQFTINEVPLSVEQQPKEHKISLYPNPANGYLNIAGKEISELSLFNTNGSLVKSWPVSRQLNRYQLNLESIPPGVYFLNTGNKKLHKVFITQ